jgi:hypothetical protein
MFSTLLKWHTTSLGRPASSAAMAAARRGRRSFTYVCQKLRHRLCLRAHRCWSPFAGSGNDTDYGSKVRSCPRTCGGGEAAAAIFFFFERAVAGLEQHHARRPPSSPGRSRPTRTPNTSNARLLRPVRRSRRLTTCCQCGAAGSCGRIQPLQRNGLKYDDL